ncbi:MAG TPA: hypothetical protein VFF00_00345 [Candidatus Elarobacter sp.]|nr:hypothetical protein [Candidatus Elarobacter sp.]
MISAAWFALVAIVAMLAGGPSFGSIRAPSTAGVTPLALITEGPYTPETPAPTPTPTPPLPQPPGSPGGGGGNITPTCPSGGFRAADGECYISHTPYYN